MSDIFTFPPNPEDGDQVADVLGETFEFDGERNSWIEKGFIRVPQNVTKEEKGLVSSETASRLQQIELIPDSFKLHKLFVSEGRPYYYFFRSSNNLITFQQSQGKLRIEADRGAILKRFLNNQCVGEKGEEGATGDIGKTGNSAKNEVFKSVEFISVQEIKIDTTVNTPIDTPVSLRLFDGDENQQIEILIGDEIVIQEEEGFEVGFSQSDFSFENNNLKTTIILENGEFAEDWKFKARQQGSKGIDGKDGSTFLELITDTAAVDPVVNPILCLRNVGNNILNIKSDIFEEICAINLSTNQLPLGDFIGLEVTTKDCKNIGLLDVELPEEDLPELVLPQWIPNKQCLDPRRFRLAFFNWQEKTDTPIPFQILNDPRPLEQCCADDFFTCNNLGDACPPEGEINTPEVIPVGERDDLPPPFGSSSSSSNSSSSLSSFSQCD